METPDLNLAALAAAYRDGSLTPTQVVERVLARIEATRESNAWIHVLPAAALRARAAELEARGPGGLPLYGVPFAIKDNIDLAGVPTTAACPEFAYTPERSAAVVERLLAAGAIAVGKTNLDQFATGLVGTRSPYGACRNAFDPAYVSGGSSAGSAVAVANGTVAFGLGTDTAGSGRVPAAFNNLVGLKPTCGLLSGRGVVPACRTIDSVSIFALTAADARAVLDVAAGYDGEDPFSRPPPAGAPAVLPEPGFRFGVPLPGQLEFFDDPESEALFTLAVSHLESLGGTAVAIDFAPFLEAARLLYEGPWVAERYAAIRAFIEAGPERLLPVTRRIIEPGIEPTAVAAFEARYRLAELKRAADRVLAGVDLVITPTAGTIYTIAAVEADPVRLNSNLGTYTNFMNLLDYSAVAVPAGFRHDGLPLGVTLFAPAFHDRKLLELGGRLHQAADTGLGATGRPLPALASAPAPGSDGARLEMVVCGAHLSGLPLNHQLTDRGGRLLARTRTAPRYRFYALPGGPPFRPGLVRVEEGGGAVEVEVWDLPAEHYGGFVAGIPAPLGIGTLELENGATAQGFLCEAYAVAGAEEITGLGSWRRYLELKGPG
ncbi:allophanate hydrolase [Thioalbus denitrificans]|uniref:Allophanate hydrolase n=1 Tax=Thioalbus denitrificans TaxID=547122 RepID=A0A369BT01_9GAMM|nr:allophanate hydrolase [Thioalbus denitrificans]RCX24780.1 allophanate hydrolase [Thioalbus denitrificans]